LGMSALPPKADMFSVEIDVCFVPIADIPIMTPILRVGGTRRKVSQVGSWQRFVRD
jgi:hypothetical protein